MRRYWSKKLSTLFGPKPPLKWLLLCLVSVLVLIALLGSSSSSVFDSLAFARQDDYKNYRRLKEQATKDYSVFKSLAFNDNRLQNVGFCLKDRENYVPCYNLSTSLEAGFENGEEFDRHCELPRDWHLCLVRPPRDYKIPLNWPIGRDIIWSGNVKLSKEQFLTSGSMTKRLMLLEENQISFHSDEGMLVDGVKDYAHLIAEMIGLESYSEFPQAGVHNVLDIGCGFGSFAAHLLSLNMMAFCAAAYESTGSQVQVSLERGLPAFIGNFVSKQLPLPALSYDMVHCAQCSIVWDDRGGVFLIEVDRVLKPGGYIVLTSPTSTWQGISVKGKKGSTSTPIEEFSQKLCWNLVAQQDETSIWQKTKDALCYMSRKGAIPLCQGEDVQSYYKPLAHCISGPNSKRWVLVHNGSSDSLDSINLELHGVHADEFSEDMEFWGSALNNYWSLLSPLIFSDHPKRPGDEDPLPPYNLIRNVMDMNAHYGGLNAALLESGKSVWVMNVVPTNTLNKLPLILDRGFAGVLHDWCEPFPTYPRTYDMLHAKGLLALLRLQRCSILDLVFEMDRILRPEGWVILSDELGAIEQARAIASQIRWEARVIDPENGTNQRLLICQKPYVRK
ncbi:hypothetical protein Leryth_002207 [Lithospermum erythrorhizon]|nr:hypothetical protein Leryth_002207 [Lithospermum erythrorhizon]